MKTESRNCENNFEFLSEISRGILLCQSFHHYQLCTKYLLYKPFVPFKVKIFISYKLKVTNYNQRATLLP